MISFRKSFLKLVFPRKETRKEKCWKEAPGLRQAKEKRIETQRKGRGSGREGKRRRKDTTKAPTRTIQPALETDRQTTKPTGWTFLILIFLPLKDWNFKVSLAEFVFLWFENESNILRGIDSLLEFDGAYFSKEVKIIFKLFIDFLNSENFNFF